MWCKDELGVIHGIINYHGNIEGRYYYNAYGLIIDMDSSNITNINPIRYKSYYYDTESEMYYLNSRYYNPMIARFITPDRFENVDLKNKQDYNLYSYCLNDPVNNEDPEGTSAILTAILSVVAVAVVAATAHDIANLNKLEPKADGNTVTIGESHRIVTPWVQFGYSFYLNHINKETKDVIKGSTTGVQFEWLCHNVAYYVGYNQSAASPVSVGTSIFSDEHEDKSFLMQRFYYVLNFPFYIYDAMIHVIFGKKKDDENET